MVAVVAIAGTAAARLAAPLQKSGIAVARRLSFAENLVPLGRPCGVEPIAPDVKCARGSVRARAPEFGRRLIRVQVNPRAMELATIRSVPVQVARELVNAGHRYLDVRLPMTDLAKQFAKVIRSYGHEIFMKKYGSERTAEEFAAGHVEGAVNIPYLRNTGGGMTKNLKFVEEVSRVFHKDDEIVVACQSGKRSLMATAELHAAEFSAVTDVVGGYKAWSNSGLPTSV